MEFPANKVITVTGHRPTKLFVGSVNAYSKENFDKLTRFAEACFRRWRPGRVITGMALGWDQAVAQACVNLDIEFVAAVPCRGQELKWKDKDTQLLYRQLIGAAIEIHTISEHYTPSCMDDRNRWMIDNNPDKLLLALWDGTSGGTKNCIDYAKTKNFQIGNVWSAWKRAFG